MFLKIHVLCEYELNNIEYLYNTLRVYVREDGTAENTEKASGHKMSALCSYAHVREIPGRNHTNKSFSKKRR